MKKRHTLRLARKKARELKEKFEKKVPIPKKRFTKGYHYKNHKNQVRQMVEREKEKLGSKKIKIGKINPHQWQFAQENLDKPFDKHPAIFLNKDETPSIKLRINPGSQFDGLYQGKDGDLKVSVTDKESELKNKTNKKLCRYFSQVFEFPKSKISIGSGLKTRDKVLQIDKSVIGLEELNSKIQKYLNIIKTERPRKQVLTKEQKQEKQKQLMEEFFMGEETTQVQLKDL